MELQSNEQHVYDNSALLSRLGQEVVESFTKVIDACKKGSSKFAQQIDPSQVQTQQERFHLWAVNLGLFSAGHGALQYRLRDADVVCDYIGRVLSELSEDLTAICDILNEKRLPYEAQIDEAESQTLHENNSIVEDAKDTDDGEAVSDLSDNTEDSTNIAETGGLSELEFRFENIVLKVDTIFNVAYKIRGPKKRSYRSNAELYSMIPAEDLAAHIEERNKVWTAIVGFIFRQELLEPQREIKPGTTKDKTVISEGASASTEKNATGSQVDSSADEFCEEQRWIIQRLGQAMARREQQFIYWSHRAKYKSVQAIPHERRAPVPPEGRAENEESRTISHTENKQHAGKSTTTGTTLNPQNCDMANNQVEETMSSAGSFISKLTSVRHVQVRKVHWPDPPTSLVKGNFFVCPMCKTICPKGYLHDKRVWRTHLVHDLQSYMCTYPGCPDQDQLYEKPTEWAAHEAFNHRRVWICQKHSEIDFETRNEYLQHLDGAHAHDAMDLRLPRLVEAAAQPSSQAKRVCPFCAAEVLGAIDMQDHIAAHLERYSILALPKLNEHDQIIQEEAESDSAMPGGLDSRYGDFEWDESVLGIEPLSLAVTNSPNSEFLALAELKATSTRYTELLDEEGTAVKLRNFLSQLPDRFAENSHDFKPTLAKEALLNRERGIDDQSTLTEVDKKHVRDKSTSTSGFELLDGISAITTIIDTLVKIWDSRKDLELGTIFKTVAKRLPILRDTLQTCLDLFEPLKASIPVDAAQSLMKIVDSCKSKAERLQIIYAETLMSEDDQWHERYRKVIQRLGEDSNVEELMEAISEDVQNLVDYHGVKPVVPELIGNLNRDQGKLEETEQMYRETMELSSKMLGLEHPDTLKSMNKLAMVLRDQGKYEEAEKMHRETVELSSKMLELEHPFTLTSMNNLATVLWDQGKYEEAEKMHRQTLELRKTVLGSEHPHTLTSMSNLALVLGNQGKYEEAEKIHRQTLELRKTVLGFEHPNTLTSMNNLAMVLKDQGKYKEAEKMHRQTLELFLKVLGVEHPNTLTSMSNLAIVIKDQGKYEQAEEIHRQVLKLRSEVLGLKNPDTLASMSNLATVLGYQGKYEEAEMMHRQTLELSKTVLGPEHPDTLANLNQLATTLGDFGKLQEALSMKRAVLEKQRQILGKNHPDTLRSMSSLAKTLGEVGELQEARLMQREAVEKMAEILGAEHPHTITSRKDLQQIETKIAELEES